MKRSAIGIFAVGFIIPAFWFVGCGNKPAPHSDSPSSYREIPKSAVTNAPEKATASTSYFPEGMDDHYVEHLNAMQEPSLYERRGDKSTEQYRFLWLRSFHNPISIRIERDATATTMRVVRLTGDGGYKPGLVAQDELTILPPEQWDGFTRLLKATPFWDMAPLEDNNRDITLDGAEWMLEGLAAGKYHVVQRWSPAAPTFAYVPEQLDTTVPLDVHSAADYTRVGKLQAFAECCQYLLRLSKIDIPPDEMY